MDELRANAISRDRLALLLLGMFGAMALIMAASGIFGVVSYTSTLRTREFGIRMALGATPAEVRGLVMRQAMTPVVLGLMLGLGGALGLTRVMADLLFHVRPFDPLTYTFVTAFLIAVAASACVLPARRATRIDPVRALRDE
jgi:putative ABC transport system permease protein